MTGDILLHLEGREIYRGIAEDFEFEVHEAGFIDIRFHIKGRTYLYGGDRISWIFMEAELPPGKVS